MQFTSSLLLSITKITQLTPRIRCYQLRAQTGTELPLITAGSHLPIVIQTTKDKPDIRCYAICSNPNQRDFYEIAILNADNQGSAHFIFENFALGTQLECGLPSNNFHLHADASPAVLIAGGIGISPIKTIAQTLAMRGRRFTLHYAGRELHEMAFVEELKTAFARQVHFYPANENKRLDIMQILSDAPSNTIFYACGPQKMLVDIETNARLLGIDADRIQCEYFNTETSEKDKAVVLELAYSNKLVKVDADQPLLSALRSAGADVNFDCCVGDCGTCAVKILEGEAEHRDHVLTDEQKAQGFMCICVSRAKGDKLVLAL
jgi:ferredoxin-NADP reductase